MNRMNKSHPYALSLKPDLPEAARRWDAFYAGDMIDRPVVCVTAPREGTEPVKAPSYRDRVFADTDRVINDALAHAESHYWGGEAVPAFSPSFGPDETAAFVGGSLSWSDDSGDTNWSVPFVEDWEKALPLRIREDSPLWRRMLALYRRGAELMAGKMLLAPLDLHTNMDLLAAIRGPARLCMDLIDQPEAIEKAMASSRALFPNIWNAISEAGHMRERGYWQNIYSMEGAAMLQCDFICMISPELFGRFVLPALEEEAAIVRHVFFHWDGPGALVHTPDVLASKGLQLLAYVPGAGRGSHLEHLDLLKRLQKGGKAVQAVGTPDEVKAMHRELKPNKVAYYTGTRTRAEADELLQWFVKHS
jgi:hypothetical protein